MIKSPDPPKSGVLAFVRSTDPQCMRALLDSGVLMPIIRSPDSSVSRALSNFTYRSHFQTYIT
ncbi:hypothetical protein ACLOJK_006924 [Asimina triloba]